MLYATHYFGALNVTADGLKEGITVPCQDDMSRYAQVFVTGRPSTVRLLVKIQPLLGTAFVVSKGEVVRVNGEYSFTVPVQWDGEMPKTRLKGCDCVTVILLLEDGAFIDLEVALITRGGSFFLSVQRIYQGDIVRTRREGKPVMDFVPGRCAHAYPGVSYKGIWDANAAAVLGEARVVGSSIPLSRTEVATWRPPTSLPMPGVGSGWRVGVVYYFNMVTGTGRIADAEGKTYFVHFSNIVDGGKVPTLTPMTAVLFRLGASIPGKDTPVKSVKVPK